MKRSKRRLLPIFLLCVSGLALPVSGNICQTALAFGPTGAEIREFSPPPLSLGERLVLQNAVCALWHDTVSHDPQAMQQVDPATLPIPQDIFLYPPGGFDYDFEENVWVFEGEIRHMGVQSDGIEFISDAQWFIMRAKQQDDGTFRIIFLEFTPLGQG